MDRFGDECLHEGSFCNMQDMLFTIKGGSRRAEKSRKVLMMMKAGVGRIRGRAGADHEQARSRLGAC